MPKKVTNWDRLKNMQPMDTTRYRDVYEAQQLERTHLQPVQDMRSRIAINIALTVFMFFVFYCMFSIFSMFSMMINGQETGVSSAIDYYGLSGWAVYCFRPTIGKLFWCFTFSAVFYFIMYLVLKHNLDAQNMSRDMSDINQYHNDQHVALPMEVMQKFDWFPDVGATSDVQVSSMISHVALSNKGLLPVMVARRADKDVLDENGEIVLYKGEVLRDEDGNILYEEKPMIDIDFMHSLFDASGLPRQRELRKFYAAPFIPYNPGGRDRDKLGDYETVADLINADWQLPYYEPQRPGGAYLVDTAPVNTMVLAITRAGKGQTVIEPTIDMWTRERKPSNRVMNDPKGELLVKFYVRETVRGAQVIQFNLINAMKTDIYNRAPRSAMKSCCHVG